jgi:hypothetical protein
MRFFPLIGVQEKVSHHTPVMKVYSVVTLLEKTQGSKNAPRCISMVSYFPHQVRLAPADQQPWLVYEEGVTVIPEWAEVIYKGLTGFYEFVDHMTYEDREFETGLLADLSYLNLYKITGIKDGWTDSPDEVQK